MVTRMSNANAHAYAVARSKAEANAERARRAALKKAITSRLNNFQTILAKHNPHFIVNKTSKNEVRVRRTNIPPRNRNEVYSLFKNTSKNGNTLTFHVAMTNNAYKKKGYQKNFMIAAYGAAKAAKYKKINAHSIYAVFAGNKPPNVNKNTGQPRFPNSYYILQKAGFKLVSTKGRPGVYKSNNPNNIFKAYFVKNI